ncbi:MAG: hypothetical protein KDD69_18400 [Bdellovibrionales bacterium]|nr:hypothetical protein [Bdellovibrionales bacterium]
MFIPRIPVEVPADDIFRNDALKREKSVDALSQLIFGVPGGFVLSMDGSWGSGKSTFLKFLQTKLRNEGRLVVPFDAWEADFLEEPLIALLSTLESSVKEYSKSSSSHPDIAALLDRLMKTAWQLGPVVMKGAIKYVLRTDEDLETFFSSSAEKMVEMQVKRFECARKELDDFRARLGDLAQRMSEAGLGPVVFIVDELDRCRPTYAIQLLECVKHLFKVEGVTFILAVDRGQLEKAVGVIYGMEVHAAGYLRKFFDIDYRLPDPSIESYCGYRLRAVLSLRGRSDFDKHELSECLTLLALSSKALSLTLREINECCTRFVIALSAATKRRPPASALILLCVLRVKEREKYKLYTSRALTGRQLLAELPQFHQAIQGSGDDSIPALGMIYSAFATHSEVKTLIAEFSKEADEETNESRKKQLGWLIAYLEWMTQAFVGAPGAGFGNEIVLSMELQESFEFSASTE